MSKEHTVYLKKTSLRKKDRRPFGAPVRILLLIILLNLGLFQGTKLFVHENGRSLVFLLDTSMSMAGEPLQKGVEGIWTCLYSLKEGTRTALVTFSDRPAERIPLTSMYETILKELAEVSAWGETDISQGLSMAEEILMSENDGSDREILLLTDAKEEAREIPDSVCKELYEKGIRVNVLALTGNENTELERLVHGTGGWMAYGQEDYLRRLSIQNSRQNSIRGFLFLGLGVVEGAFLLLVTALIRHRKRRGTLPNAGYMNREEIASFLGQRSGIPPHKDSAGKL